MTTKILKVIDAECGVKVSVKRVSPVMLQRAIQSIPEPEKPTYTAKTSSGREEIHMMDEKSAEQTEHGVDRWNYYLHEMQRYQEKVNQKSQDVLLFMGTDCEISDESMAEWIETCELFGMPVPEQGSMRRVAWLLDHLKPEELVDVVNTIMADSGVSEEEIAAAEESFRGQVREGTESKKPEGN